MSQQRVRVGVIGAGSFAEVCHVPGIQSHPSGEVVALCARNRERVSEMARRLRIEDVHTDYHELLARSDIDAVTVVTPDALHLPVVLAALRAGKHVFCEKPLAMDVDEAQRMVAAAEQSGLVAMVAFTYRYTRALPTLRRLIAERALGAPFYVAMQVHWGGIGFPWERLTWREQSTQSAAGVWGDGAPHLFDALAYVLAPAEEVCAQLMIVPRGSGEPQPDNVDLATCLARLQLPDHLVNGSGRLSDSTEGKQRSVHVTLLTSRVDHPRTEGDSMYVLGTDGAAEIALTRGQRERVSLLTEGRAWENVRLADDATTDNPMACTRMMGAFIDAVLRGHLHADDPDFAAGMRAQQALEAAIRSTRTGRWERV